MEKEFSRIVSEKMRGNRLDHYLLISGIGISRNRIIKLIQSGQILVNSKIAKPSYRVKTGDEIIARFELPKELEVLAEPMDLDIAYEDDYLIVVNKPKGMIVHPARGNIHGTLVQGLLYHCGNLPQKPKQKIRPGVVHRLDKDTTGLLVFAKTDDALSFLGKEIENRRINRDYLALVWGDLAMSDGTIEAPIGRHTLDRKKMAVTPFAAKEAITHFEVLERFKIVTYIRLRLLTGRTHQIRVHMLHYGHPIVGDPDYGGRNKNLVAKKEDLPIFKNVLGIIDRQALHATKLGFTHPMTKKYLEFTAPLPEDMERLLAYFHSRFA